MAILDDTEITKPVFPGLPPVTTGGEKLPYDYLATIGLTENVLKHCCIKKVEITGISTRESVIVDLEGTEYEDVPVWIHTDIGTRLAMVQGTLQVDPSLYFKDSALMFPFTECEALAIVYTNPETLVKEVVSIIHVIKAPKGIFPTETTQAFPTYRMYARFALFSDAADGSYFLYDILNDQVAEIPTIATLGGEPELPFITCDHIAPAEEHFIANFCANGVAMGMRGLGTTANFGDRTWAAKAEECYESDGGDVSPGWVQVSGPLMGENELTIGVPDVSEWQMQCHGGNLVETQEVHSTATTEGTVQYTYSATETMPVIYETKGTYVNSAGCFGVSFFTGGTEFSGTTTIPDGDGTINILLSGEAEYSSERFVANKKYDEDCVVYYPYTGDYGYNRNGQKTFSTTASVSLFGEAPMTLSWEIATNYTAYQYGLYDPAVYSYDYDYYSAIKLGKMFRCDENLFADFISISFFMYVDYQTAHCLISRCVPPTGEETGTGGEDGQGIVTSVKQCIGPSKDFVKDNCLIDTLHLTEYAYSQLAAYILAGDYELSDFLVPEVDWPCGIVFSGFYFVPYDIREDLLTT